MLEITELKVHGLQPKGLSLCVGEVVALTGASGTGKSQFLKSVADLIVHEGTVRLDNRDRESYGGPDWRKKVCYLGASPAWWYERVGDHFRRKDLVKNHLDSLGLSSEVLDWPVSRLSSGEAQRLALLRSLQIDVPPLSETQRYFLLDEPTSALDIDHQIKVEQFLRDYLSADELGLIMVSHDEHQVERFADRRWEIKGDQVKEVYP